jgi:hypothetical protein
MDHGVQTVMAQKSVEIGSGGFRCSGSAGGGKEYLSALSVEPVSQSIGGGMESGTVVEEKVRTLKTGIIHPAEPLNALMNLGGKTGQQKPAKSVMGITCGHKDHLGKKLLVSILHDIKQKGNSIVNKVMEKAETLQSF